MSKQETKKSSFNLSLDTTIKLEDIAIKMGIPKNKVIDILIKKVNLELFSDEFSFYNLKIK